MALKNSDLLVKETVPQGKKVPKNYFLLLKRGKNFKDSKLVGEQR